MFTDRITSFAFLISLLFHAALLLLLPGQRIMEIVNEPEWMEVDIMDIPPVKVPDIRMASGQKPGHEQPADDAAEGDSGDLPMPPLWLPERLDRFDADPVSSALVLPGNFMPEIAGNGNLLPGNLPDGNPGDETGDAKDLPPNLHWEPGRQSISDIVGENPDDYFIQGPVAQRKIIYRPPPPHPAKALSGTVRLKFWVNPDGTIGKIVPIVRGDTELERIAMAYLEKWRFETIPANRGRQWGTIPVRFTLN